MKSRFILIFLLAGFRYGLTQEIPVHVDAVPIY